jgi:hypothetical protein
LPQPKELNHGFHGWARIETHRDTAPIGIGRVKDGVGFAAKNRQKNGFLWQGRSWLYHEISRFPFHFIRVHPRNPWFFSLEKFAKERQNLNVSSVKIAKMAKEIKNSVMLQNNPTQPVC